MNGRFEKRPPFWVKEGTNGKHRQNRYNHNHNPNLPDAPGRVDLMQCAHCEATATWRIVHPRVDGVRDQSYACDNHNPADDESGSDVISLRCLYCETLAGEGHYVCETCDRDMRNRTRLMNGLPSFTETEYRALRQSHGRAKRVLVLNGGSL